MKTGPLAAPVVLRAFEQSKSAKVGAALLSGLRRARSLKSLPAREIQRILNGYPKAIQNEAGPLLQSLGVNPGERRKRIDALLKLSANGDATRGRVVFFSRKAACASCHTIGGQGGRVGPDLSTIGKIRTPRDLVEAIAFPSATLARGFRSYRVATDRGKVHSGLIARETADAIVLRTTSLAEVRIPRRPDRPRARIRDVHHAQRDGQDAVAG